MKIAIKRESKIVSVINGTKVIYIKTYIQRVNKV